MPLSWGDIVEMQEAKERLREGTFVRMMAALPKTIINRGLPFYNQSGSPIVDELRGIMSMGDCYSHRSFQIKLIL